MKQLENFTSVSQVIRQFGLDGFRLMKEELGIECKPFEDGKLYMCNYDQIESPKTHPLVIQCRSLIVDSDGDIVSKKYDRFFNIGECPEIVGKINLGNCKVMEKADGSLIGIWWNRVSKRFSISSRSMPLCEGLFEMPDGSTFTWETMILATLYGVEPEFVGSAIRDDFQSKMSDIDSAVHVPWTTFVFEWVSPLNRIVTPYDKPEMVFVTATDYSGNEIDEKDCDDLFIEFKMRFSNTRKIGSHQFTCGQKPTLEDLERIVSNLDGLQEGLVIQCRDTGIRAKIKSKTYLAAHRLRGEFKIPRDKDLCELIQTNETDEFLAYFPEWKERVDEIKNDIDSYLKTIKQCYEDNDEKDLDQKEFALRVKSGVDEKRYGTIAASLMFQLRKLEGSKDMMQLIREFNKNRYFDFYQESKYY